MLSIKSIDKDTIEIPTFSVTMSHVQKNLSKVAHDCILLFLHALMILDYKTCFKLVYNLFLRKQWSTRKKSQFCKKEIKLYLCQDDICDNPCYPELYITFLYI